MKPEGGFNKDVKPKPVKRVREASPAELKSGGSIEGEIPKDCAREGTLADVKLDGKVNGYATPILLDSGATISIVPESMVAKVQLTGKSVPIKPFGQSKLQLLPSARVTLKIGTMEWEEEVAVQPYEKGIEEEVIYSLKLTSERGLRLVMQANGLQCNDVKRVITRAQARVNSKVEQKEAVIIVAECPVVTPITSQVCQVAEVVTRPAVVDTIGGGADAVESEARAQGTDKGNPAEDRPVVAVPNSVAPVAEVVEKELNGPLGSCDEGCEEDTLAPELESSGEGDEVLFKLREGTGTEFTFDVQPVKSGHSGRDRLVEETRANLSLDAWRQLADRGERGFLWEDDLLYRTTTTHVFETVHLLVLPESFRRQVLVLAHDKSGHLGARKVKALVRQKFTWPDLGKYVMDYCRSCEVCQRCSSQQPRRHP